MGKRLIRFTCFLLALSLSHIYAQTNPGTPNILLIISDDLGVDVTNGYALVTAAPNTPTLDSLRSVGVTFQNAWAAPQCTPTRAAIMSGKYGVKSGVPDVPGDLDSSHHSVFRALDSVTNGAYTDALIGKWHIGSNSGFDHPTEHGIDYYEGVFSSQVSDYYNWDKFASGSQVLTPETQYATSYFTDKAADWIKNQNSSWLMWLAHVAPHSPFHVPPANLHNRTNTNPDRQKYLASIEAMDAEIGRLLDSIPPAVLANTVVIYIGDNGTPGGVGRVYPSGQAKSTVYQGGVHVPLIVAGAGVTRQNATEGALVHAADIYATILEVAGANLPGGIHNSMSFEHLLTGTAGPTRPYNYSEIGNDWTIRNARYKLIEFSTCVQEFYDLQNDTLELVNLIGSLTPQQELIRQELENEADKIRGDWSCSDLIQNGSETAVDVCVQTCPPNTPLSYTNTGCCATPAIPNVYTEVVVNNKRQINTNNFPSHQYCFTNNNVPAPKAYSFEVPTNPVLATTSTSIVTDCNRPDNYFGVALNGVLIAPAPATPFIFENPNTGEYNWDWVFEPTTNQGNGRNLVALDCSSGHTGPQGYHYHGNMFEYVESTNVGLSTTTTPPAGPMQIGWAADGFPIVYRFGPDGTGSLALLQPGYKLKQGNRPGDGIVAPCGAYNGKYTNDYEFDTNHGDLDACNGIQRSITLTTAQGLETFSYFYVVTDSFPQVPRCISGTPDTTFDSQNNGTPIPLSLTRFEAFYNEAKETVELNWTAAEDHSIAHFEIEKSNSGNDFMTIQHIDAQVSADIAYQYEDGSALTNIQYYRLKMVDWNGSTTYSDTRIVSLQGAAYINRLTLSPNPTQDVVFLQFDRHQAGTFHIEILNSLGQIVMRISDSTERSDTRVSRTLSLKKLPEGTYFIKLRSADGVAIEKIVKTN
ncbi:MAG: sulfatase-like hydrolase/transferase [Bacteroidia bacterium]